MVHNHGPNKGEGLDCPEYTIDNRPIGRCILSLVDNYEHWLRTLQNAEAMRERAIKELSVNND